MPLTCAFSLSSDIQRLGFDEMVDMFSTSVRISALGCDLRTAADDLSRAGKTEENQSQGFLLEISAC